MLLRPFSCFIAFLFCASSQAQSLRVTEGVSDYQVFQRDFHRERGIRVGQGRAEAVPPTVIWSATFGFLLANPIWKVWATSMTCSGPRRV